MKVIYGNEKKRILKELQELYGIEDLPYLLVQFGKEKIRAYSGSFSTEELRAFDRYLRIETMGVYFLNVNSGFRLTFDGVGLFKDQIVKNIVELDDEQFKEWMSGGDLNISMDRGYKVLKYGGEFVGCGKSTGERITNHVPKERRIKG